MIKQLAILLPMLLLINSRCTEGCLRCTPDNKCLYCDVLEDYRLFNGRCVKSETNNCVLVNDKNHCLKCKEEFYLDQVSSQCVELFDKIKVDNCAHHQAPKKCEVCKEGFVLQNELCVKIATPIQNCSIENERAECEQCKSGYILALDYKSCNKAPEINHCGTYRHVKCNSCKSNYFYNENFYSDLLYGFDNSYQFRLLHRMRQDQDNGVIDSHRFSTCQKKEVDHCLVFDDFESCKKCQEGYFVNPQQQCELIPAISLHNCLRYSSATSCIDCAPGYFLKNDKECLPVIPIQNCMLYKTNANFSSCIRCTDNYYLSAENLCTRRTDISNIDLCERLSHEFEKCDVCADGYRPTSDGYRCLPQIKYCLEYGFTNTNSFSHTCTQCEKGFFYNEDDKVCIKGKIPFCEDYDYDQHECIKCQKNFYLNFQRCEPHQKLPFCMNYSENDKNLCTKCEASSMLFQQTGSCERVDRIQHCAEYENKTFCKRCEDGYYARTQTYCELIKPQRKCLQLNPENFKCEKCLPNYLINNGECIKPEPYLINGCTKWKNDGTGELNDFKCEACKMNFVPVEFQDTFACKKLSTMMKKQFKSQVLNLDQHCAQYEEKEDNFECVKCKQNFYLVNKTCSPNCYESDKLTIYRQWVSIDNRDGDDKNESLKINRTNICERTIPNCAVASLDISQDFVNIKYVCERCVNGYLPVVTKGNVINHVDREVSIQQHMPMSSKQAIRCVDPVDYIVVGDTQQNKSIEDCELYEEIAKNVLGCRTCSFSFVGTVNQLVRQCKVFNQDETCKECNPLHYLKNKYECVPVKVIENCQEYDGKEDTTKCTECKQNYYVEDNQCMIRVNSMNKPNCDLKVNEDVCECQDGFMLNPQKQSCEKLPDDCKVANFTNGVKICTECDDTKSYLQDGVCLKGTISKCIEYHQVNGTCNKCQNGYYKDQAQATKCIQHTTGGDSKCKTWSQTNKDQCDECTSDSTLFNKVNECRQVSSVINNCKMYVNEFACKECNEGYYLNNVSKTCLSIPDELNCLKLSVVDFVNEGKNVDDYTVDNKYLHTCDICKEGYFRKLEQEDIKKKSDPNNIQKFAVFKCKDWLSYMRENCEETQIDGTKSMGKITCQGCKSQYFPYNLKDKMICVNRDYIKERKNGFIQDSNCLAYDYVNNKMKCLECKYPKVLKNDSCVDDCGTGELKYAAYIDSNNRYKKNVCVKGTAITNCDWYVPAENDTATSKVADSYTCFQCKDGFQKIYKAQDAGTGANSKLKVTIFNPFVEDVTIKSPGDTYAEFDCVDISGATLRGLKNGTKNEIENCDLYTVIEGTPVYGCKKCKFGYRGRVVKTTGDDEGHIEYCEVFDDCDTNVVGGLSVMSVLEAGYGPLNNYMSCLACKNNKLLVSFMDKQTGKFLLAQYTTDFVKDGTNKYVDGTDPSNSFNLQCLDPANDLLAAHDAADDVTKTKLIKKAAANDALVDNCAIMLLNVNAIGTFNTANQICLSCKPNFEPTLTANVITSCTQLEAVSGTNCATQANQESSLNVCSNCVLLINNNTKVLVKSTGNAEVPDCLDTLTAMPNCYAGYDDSGTKKCVICNKGYEVHTDGKCYQIKLDSNGNRKFNMNDYFWNTIGITTIKWRDFSHLAQDYSYQGEISCNKEDVLYKVTDQDDNLGMTTCITEFNDQGAYDAGLNMYLNGANSADYVITGCTRYGFIDGKLVCRQCENTHIITLDYKCLEASASPNNVNLPNCVKAEKEGSAVCVECQPNYRNVGGYCLDEEPGQADFNNKTHKDYFVQNCKVYSDLTRLNYKGICSECNDNFYIKNLISPFNKCVQIPSWAGECKDFLDNTGCIKCKNGYGLVDIKGEGDNIKRACVKMSTTADVNNNNFEHDLNCVEMVGVGDTESLTKQKLKCQKCKDNYVLVQTFQSFQQRCYSVVTPITNCIEYDFAVNEVEKIKNSTYKCTKCADKNLQFLDLVNNVCTDRTNTSNCDEFDKNSDRCLVCNDGYRLDEAGVNCTDLKSNTREGYLQTCKQDMQCDKRYRCEGLNSQMNSIYTCHKCREQDQIPFAIVYLKEDVNRKELEYIQSLNHNVSGMQQWNINDDKPSQQIMQCMKPDSTSFNLKSGTSMTLPTNCSLGMIDLSKLNQQDNTYDASDSNKQSNPDLTKTGIRCVACQPKYKATKASHTRVIDTVSVQFNLDLLVTACTLIPKCESSTWFNACTQCEPGYSYNYNKEQGILYDECVTVGDNKYCEAIDSTTSQCMYCKKGTYMNEDGICEIINPEKCEFGQFRYRGNFQQRDLQRGIFYTNEIVGCNKCQQGYVPVLINKPTKICTHSMYHVQESFVNETLYIQNCISYGLDPMQQLVCKKCNEGFVISSHHSKQCYPDNSIKNCVKAFNANVCVQCSEDFVLVDSQCVVPSIDKCKEYGNNELKKECHLCTSNEQKCIKCEEEHYLSGGKCIKGEVKYCKHLETSTQCIECKDNYTLINMKGGKSYCYPIDPRFKCNKFDQEKLQSGILECEECKDDRHIFSLSKTDSRQNTCMTFDFIHGCIRYNNNPIALADSNFQCIECNPKTYLDNGECKDRVSMPDECIQYAIDLDECIRCQEGYYISSDAKNCIAYPQGLFGCLIYQSKTVCAKCQSQFVLRDEKCIPIEIEIPNCKYYEDLTTCLECESGFVNRDGKCQQPFAVQCATYLDSTNCETCLQNFHLELNADGITNCVADEIQNCSSYNDLPPYGCADCAGEFYVADGACVAITDKIEGCIEYSDAKVCKKCSSDYAMKYDGSVCLKTPEVVSQIDLNCQESMLTEQPSCNTCQPGYYFVYGQCVSCPEEVLDEGCYTCDPREPERCLMCQSGYVQSPEGDCVKPMIESFGLQQGESLDNLLTR